MSDVVTPGFVGPLSLDYGVTGRAAHLTVKVTNPATEVVYYGPSGTDLEEDEAGIYDIDAFVYPSTEAVYRVLWYDDGALIPGAVDEFRVSYTAASADAPPSNAERYVTIGSLKDSLTLTGSYADADLLIALDSASRGLEDIYETLWLAPYTGTRYYTRTGPREVHLGDVQIADTVALDYAYSDLGQDGRVWDWDTGLGTYSTILDPSWYRLLPVEAGPSGNGEPYRTLQLSRASQRFILPSGQDAIKITGTFGWQATPSGLQTAVKMIATRLLARTREAPFGLVALGAEGAIIRARDIATDPDIRFAMNPLTGTTSLFV